MSQPSEKVDGEKKILLINPRFPTKIQGLNIPMGLMYTGSHLFRQGYTVNILDMNNAKYAKGFARKVRNELPNVLCAGLSVMSAQIPCALEISEYIRKFDPSIPIIWGGVHPTLYPKQTAKCQYVDFVVRGEGEITSLELVRAIERRHDMQKVKGIAFQNNNSEEIIMTADRELMDVDRLPSIEWRLLEDVRRIGSIQEAAKLTAEGIPLQTSRGCPHRCAFCINSILKQKYRFREIGLVLKDIRELVKVGVNRISFVDEAFIVGKKRLLEIVERIERERLNFRWFGNVRADYFRPSFLNLSLLLRLRRNGCNKVGIGAESGSQKILNHLDKDITVEETVAAANLLSKAGIKANFSFMIGVPGETEDDMKKTVQLIKNITQIDAGFQILGPQIFRPYPGSKLYLECLRSGMNEPKTLTEWARSPYIQRDINPEYSHMFPWIRYPLKYLNNLIFYSSWLGSRLQCPLVSNMVRLVASKRCDAFYFKYPVERQMYNVLKKIGAVNVLKTIVSRFPKD